MFRGARNTLLLSAMGMRLARHGITPGRLKRGKIKGEQLARAMEKLGPAFIKLGQVLSTRADLIGTERAAALASLRDQLAPFPTTQAKKIIVGEFGRPLDEMFAEFPETPVAAASVAQVYKAQLKNGQPVAVKVIRPRVRQRFARDIALFAWAAAQLEKRVPAARRLKPLEVIRTLERSVGFELDLRYEAAAMDEMRQNIKIAATKLTPGGNEGWRVPKPEWPYVGGRAMAVEWIDGIPIHDVAALKAAGHDTDVILERLAEHFFLHVFRDGFFHADLHPGNVFVDAAGNIAVVDFGIMGRLPWRERLYVAEIFRGFLNEDFHRVALAHFRAGYVPAHHSVEEFALACRAIAKPILGRPAREVSVAKLLGQLFAVTEAFEMETQPQLLLLQKTLVVVEGVGRTLNPNVNMWEMARPPIEAWAREHFSARGRVRQAAVELREVAQKLPQMMQRLEEMLDA